MKKNCFQADSRRLTHLSLFSGIGGLDLAAEMAGFETVGQVEWADYPTKVLEKHWPEIPRWRDIRELTKEDFYERTGLRTVDIISGGFPCQPFSLAGPRAGEADDRYLWPEMLRVIQEIRPAWVVGENVPGIINLALDTVLSDLESIGYTCQTFVIPACGVDAPHRRDRVAILAHADAEQLGKHWEPKDAAEDGRKGSDNRGRTAAVECGEHQGEPGIVGMADGLRTAVYGPAADTGEHEVQGGGDSPVLDAAREREREREGQRYKSNLDELLECTPLGKIGLMNPNWTEWFLGFPIGWTELNALETR